MTIAKSSQSKPNGNGRIGLVLLVFLVIVVIFGSGLVFNRQTASGYLKEAENALERDEFTRALTLAEQSLQLEPANPKALMVAGQAAAANEDFQAAVGHFRKIPEESPALANEGRLQAADIFFTELKRPSDAAELYREVLKLTPGNTIAIHRMAYLLGLAGRNWEATPYRLLLLRANQAAPIDLYLLCNGDRLLQNIDELKEFYKFAPTDGLVLGGMTKTAMNRQDFVAAEEFMRTSIDRHPENLAAYIDLGELLLLQQRDSDLIDWLNALPADIEEHPGYWRLLGNWSRGHSKQKAAIRCFWEALKRDPTQSQSAYQLGRLLHAEERPADAERFLSHAESLEAYFTLVSAAWTGEDLGAAREAAALAESLGMIWEALGWASLMQKHHSNNGWSKRMLQRLRPEASELSLIRIETEKNPATHVDLSDFQLPKFDVLQFNSRQTKLLEPETAPGDIQFHDESADVGITKLFYNGSPRSKQTRRMYEFNGGGVAVLDFDSDGWPDIFLTQGNAGPDETPIKEWSDSLYRNLSGAKFKDVAGDSMVEDVQFSSGTTVGDFNNDGFPDLYICNVHSNSFLMNNGDGTFEDITAATETGGDDWSSSCVLADLNGDSLPDLYVVNYLAGEDIFTRVCLGEQDQIRSCSPRQFSGAQDRLYLNQGDGSFANITETSGIELADGKGLGIVTMNGNVDGVLNLFVANDAVPNFFFVGSTNETQSSLQFTNQALLSGLAINEQGLSEACMGVAVGDADQDGLIDLFVTNFHNESNTFYRQNSAGIFEDSTRAHQLHESGLKMLGFGTQFIDAELNGELDIIVTNGHIDDLSDEGMPYEMRTQFYRNNGRGTFTELPSNSLGAYFAQERLGRGLARLDWNRDGRDDIGISNLDTPFALLSNQTDSDNHYLSVHLRGTRSSRDAIGSVVSVTVGDQQFVRELTAGDGFQASNERRMIVGLGKANSVDKLTIQWPSGLVQQFENLHADTEMLFLESFSEPFILQMN